MKLRDQRGAVGADHLGVLFVVAAIVAAIVHTGLPGKIADEAERIVCEIAGGGSCRATAQPPPPDEVQQPGDDDGPTRGPAPIPDGPLVVLPFPGSVSVTCSVAKDSPSECMPPKGPGVWVQASGQIGVERSQTKLNGKGCPRQVLSVSTTLKLEGIGSAKGKNTKGKLSAALGAKTKYEVNVAPDQADAIERGDRPPPNALDPRSMRTGESVQMSEEYFASVGLTAEYRALQMQMGYDRGQRVSAGVTRLDASTVRVYVGDESFVRHALALGIGIKGGKISIGGEEDLSNGKLRAVDIDISGPEGWDAYQQFVTSGQLPADGAPGTRNPTRSTTTKYTDSSKIEAELGGIKVGGQLGDSEGNLTETRHPDGSVETSLTARYNDIGLEIITRKDANGNPVGEPVYAINAEGVDKNIYAGFQKINGRDMTLPPGGNVRMEFTRSDFETIQNQALDQIRWELREAGMRNPPSREEIKENLERNNGALRFNGGAPFYPKEPGGMFARADNPEDMLIAMWRMGWRDPNRLFEELSGFVSRSALANGDIRRTDDRSRFPDTVVTPNCPS